MSQQSPIPSPKEISFTALGMAAGLLIGGLIGLIMDSLVLSAGGGMLLGLAIGLAFESRRQ